MYVCACVCVWNIPWFCFWGWDMWRVFMIGGFTHPRFSPFLNWESEGLNRNQFLQFIFNFFLLSQDWFLSLWSMAERIAPWPEQLFKPSVWSTPHLLNGTLEADYESNRMKMFKGWAWLPLPSWWKMPSGRGWVRQWDTLLFPVGKTYHGEAGKRGVLGDQLLVCQPDCLPPFLCFLLSQSKSLYFNASLNKVAVLQKAQIRRLIFKVVLSTELTWQPIFSIMIYLLFRKANNLP